MQYIFIKISIIYILLTFHCQNFKWIYSLFKNFYGTEIYSSFKNKLIKYSLTVIWINRIAYEIKVYF